MYQRSFLFLKSLVLAVSVLIFTNCSNNGNNKELAKGGKETPPIPVNGVIINAQEFESKIEVIGTILPNEKVDLKSEAAGRVTRIFFKEGSKINHGELLVKIYNDDLLAQLKKINVQQEQADREEERKRKLLEISAIPQQEYDLAKNQADALKADASLIDAQLRKTEIHAPFHGIIGLRNISEGEIVSTSTLIASLQQIDPIKIEFDIPEKYSFYVSQGSSIDFTMAGNDQVYQGTVYAAEPMIDVNTRTLKVRARCSNKDQKLKPGAFIKIDLVLKKNKNAILIPTESVVPGMKGQKVFVCKNGQAFSKKIKTGVRTDQNLEILEGLDLNDTLITTGIMQMKDSVKVKLRLKK